jgi:UDP-glucose 4-epimerase
MALTMRWLITGGCGFIGRNLIRTILRQPDETIRVIDDLSVGTRQDLAGIHPFRESDAFRVILQKGQTKDRLELVVGDVRDKELAVRVSPDVDVVVHLAANTGVGPSVDDPYRDCEINVIGTLNYLEACRSNGIRRFVFASSGAPIGECEPPIHEELAAHPVSPYGASKLAGEGYCSAYHGSFGLHTVALRFGNCYGPYSGHKGSVVAKFIREAMDGKSWEIFGDGGQTRDFIYVDDVVEAILKAATAEDVGGQIFQIATNSETTIFELANKMQGILGRRGINVRPLSYGSLRVGDVRRNYSDTAKARARLKWTSRVALDDGLERTVEWFVSRHET